MSRYEREKKAGLEAVWKASFLAREAQANLDSLQVINKEDFSPVTVVDFSIQALINHQLANAFPDIPIMGEEDTSLLRSLGKEKLISKILEQTEKFQPSFDEDAVLEAIDKGNFEGSAEGRYWVLDPIDGTRGFIQNERYAIALALIDNGEVVLSIMGCPGYMPKKFKKDGIFVANKNSGCLFFPYDSSHPLKVEVNPTDKLEETFYCEPHATSKTHSHTKAVQIAETLGMPLTPLRMDSQCKYGLVASGDVSIYFRIPIKGSHREKVWDHAPGALIVEESGGIVTDLDGRKLDYSTGKNLIHNRGILATNGRVHRVILETISKLGF